MGEYSTSDVANIVGIAKPTVNKYSLVLERAGYLITKNDKGNRIYMDNDIEMLNKMKEKSNELKMPVAQIAEILIAEQKYDTPVEETTVLNSTTLKQNEVENSHTLQIPNEFKAFFQNEFESMRKELVNDFQILLEEKFKVMERDRELTTIREAAATKEKRKGFWSKLFRSE